MSKPQAKPSVTSAVPMNSQRTAGPAGSAYASRGGSTGEPIAWPTLLIRMFIIVLPIALIALGLAGAWLLEVVGVASVIPFLFEGVLPDFNIGTANGASCAPAIA